MKLWSSEHVFEYVSCPLLQRNFCRCAREGSGETFAFEICPRGELLLDGASVCFVCESAWKKKIKIFGRFPPFAPLSHLAALYYSHVFGSHSWFSVSTASWRKYPNPFNPAIVSIDILDRKVTEDGKLLTRRLLCTDFKLPNWFKKVRECAAGRVLAMCQRVVRERGTLLCSRGCADCGRPQGLLRGGIGR
jgi:hypothetical protein